MTEVFHLLVQSPKAAKARKTQAPRHPSRAHPKVQGPSSRATLGCFSRCVGRELGRKLHGVLAPQPDVLQYQPQELNSSIPSFHSSFLSTLSFLFPCVSFLDNFSISTDGTQRSSFLTVAWDYLKSTAATMLLSL